MAKDVPHQRLFAFQSIDPKAKAHFLVARLIAAADPLLAIRHGLFLPDQLQ